ncbi:MAG: cupin domain-containing protein [Chlorobiaceae bacterium]|nr:cupin domain-containing protein [Chlorobiaceae bacterium]
MKKRFIAIIPLLMFWLMPTAANADGYANVKVDKLLVSSTTYTGQQLSYNKSDSPEVTALVVHIPPGGSTGWHKHPIPVYAYMLDGELTIGMKDGSSYLFRKGEVILEVLNILHNGVNKGDKEASLMVFYSGTSGVPNVIREEPISATAVSGNSKD